MAPRIPAFELGPDGFAQFAGPTDGQDIREQIADLAGIRRRLLILRQDLVRALTSGSTSLREGSETFPDGAADSHHFVLATLRDVAAQIMTVNAALGRIANGTYGICGECRVQIKPARLVRNLTVFRCCVCQERFERRQRFRVTSSHTPLRIAE
jgi:RNA polymerase-binding transcription factor DksA